MAAEGRIVMLEKEMLVHDALVAFLRGVSFDEHWQMDMNPAQRGLFKDYHEYLESCESNAPLLRVSA